MRRPLLLLLLGLLAVTSAVPGKKKKFVAEPAVPTEPPTQIEEPPAESNEDDESEEEDESEEVEEDEDWDIAYTVDRPTSAPEEEDAEECERNYESEGEGDKACVREGVDVTPYKKYKAYKTWKSRPLFVIIIGG